MSNNIFDTQNIHDLPEFLKNQLKKGYGKDTEKLLSLFDLKETLNIDEIIVGLFRKYQLEKNRVWVTSTAYNLTRIKLLESLGSGIYRKVKALHTGK
jgi:hypothetical protein